MNKNEAVAYAQITLNYMQSSKYTGKLNPETFALEMRQAFKLYTHDIVQHIANEQINANKKLNAVKSGRDVIE